MITTVQVRYFKRFKDQTFDLNDHVVLAGPNNSGKTTLLQAIIVWSLALQKWRERRGPESGSKATKRPGVPVTRQDFTALPLRLTEHLWTDTITSLRKDEREGDQKPGEPRLLEITLQGKKAQNGWRLGFDFRYSSSEQLYITPVNGEIPAELEDFSVVYVPPFSGIGHAETRMDRPYQNFLIGQGKAGDILRNLLLEVYEREDQRAWTALRSQVSDLFKVDLLSPEYAGRPHIICEYEHREIDVRKGRARPRFDIASAGSGFHQVLLLLGFFYARPATILLLDEPDAHLHVILQKQIYDTLRRVAGNQSCQLLVATHSEVLIDNTAPEQILSFYGEPHRLRVDTERDQVREALKRLSAMDILLVERARGVLYVEDQADADLLKAWARVLNHPASQWFEENPLIHLMRGRKPREARGHFFALKAVNDAIVGYVLLDGDNRDEPDTAIRADGLEISRWLRYEAESYLVHPESLRRFLEARVLPLFQTSAEDYLVEQLPPVVYRNPLEDSGFWTTTPVSKTLLPRFFKAAEIALPSTEYYLVAECMKESEVPEEVRKKLDSIARVLGIHS